METGCLRGKVARLSGLVRFFIHFDARVAAKHGNPGCSNGSPLAFISGAIYGATLAF